jgi:MFS family permease
VIVTALGTSQTLAWASSYYLPAILADPIARDLGIPRAWVFAAFSGALLIAAVLGPAIGRAIDRHGGRGVLVLSKRLPSLAGPSAYACPGQSSASAWRSGFTMPHSLR